jgi:hypothetical protein
VGDAAVGGDFWADVVVVRRSVVNVRVMHFMVIDYCNYCYDVLWALNGPRW